MSHLNLVAAACSALLAVWPAAAQQAPPGAAGGAQQEERPADYKLVWADEFDKDGRPDPLHWTYERGFVRNEELQWYQPDNARCRDGLLLIEGRRERVTNPNHDPNSKDWKRSRQYADYTSACLTTRGRQQWTYGRFEMRGRIDTRPGIWPAWWALGTLRGWPACGEIDMMEFYRGQLLANACWAGSQRRTPVWDTFKKPIDQLGDPGWSSKFHVWRMDWDRQAVRLYVDGELLNTIELNKTINADREKSNPFTEPHYMLLNLAIGGQAGGDPSQTEFPARFEVDYVRVYQRPPQDTAAEQDAPADAEKPAR
jgi:beta-glucanase (GH16 family)